MDRPLLRPSHLFSPFFSHHADGMNETRWLLASGFLFLRPSRACFFGVQSLFLIADGTRSPMLRFALMATVFAIFWDSDIPIPRGAISPKMRL